MSPRPAFANGGYQAHRHTVLVGQGTPDPVVLGSEDDCERVGLTQFGSRHFSTAWVILRISPTVAARNAFRMLPRPVGIPSDPSFRMKGVAAALAARGPAMTFAIRAILGGRGPIEVARAVVRFVAIYMSGVMCAARRFAMECYTDKAMNADVPLRSVTKAQDNRAIAARDSRLEMPSEILALPVRGNAFHAPKVRNRVARCPINRAPVFHAFNIGRIAQEMQV